MKKPTTLWTIKSAGTYTINMKNVATSAKGIVIASGVTDAVTLNFTDVVIDVDSGYGIDGRTNNYTGTLTITGTLNVTSSSKNAITTKGALTISGVSTSVTATVKSGSWDAIYSSGGTVTIQESAQVTATSAGASAIGASNAITIRNATVTASGGCGLNVSNGTLTISGTDTVVVAKGSDVAIWVSSGAPTLNNGLTALAYDGTGYSQAVTWVYSNKENDPYYESYANGSTAKDVQIKVFHDYAVTTDDGGTWEESDTALTIKSAGTYTIAMANDVAKSTKGIVIASGVTGAVTLNFDNVVIDVDSGYGIYAPSRSYTLAITGTLDVTSSTCGIYADGAITISDSATVSVTSESGAAINVGRNGDKLTISGADTVVTLIGGKQAIEDGSNAPILSDGLTAKASINNGTTYDQAVEWDSTYQVVGTNTTATHVQIKVFPDYAVTTDGDGTWEESADALTITKPGTYNIAMANGVEKSAKGIEIASGVTGAVTLNFDDVEIDVDSGYGIDGRTNNYTGALTITGVVDVTNSGGAAIITDGNLTISGDTTNVTARATGSNSSAINASGNVTIQDAATVTATATGTNGPAIYSASGDVTIQDAATVTATTHGASGSAIRSKSGNVTIQGTAIVTATATATENLSNSYGICAKNNLSITGGIVNATSKGDVSAIYSDTGDITISGTDTKVTATAEGDFSSAHAIYAADDLSITDATVTASPAYASGVRAASGTVTITNATVESQGNLTAESAAFAITDSTVTVTSLQGMGASTISNSTVTATGTGNYGIYLNDGSATLTISGEDTVVIAKGTKSAIYASSGVSAPTLNNGLTALAYDGTRYTEAVIWDRQYELADGSAATDVLISTGLDGTVDGTDFDDAVTAEGLDDVALEVLADVTLTVAETTDSAEGASAIATAAGEEAVIDYMDITLTTTVGATLIPSPTTVLEICIPYDYTDKSDIAVYRYHEGVDTFTALSEKATAPYTNGQFFADQANGKLYIYTNQFSTYAVGYTLVSGSGSSAGSTQRPITINPSANGSVSLSNTSAMMNTPVTITAMADDGYTVGAVTVTYTSGREVEVTDNGDGTYTYLQPGAAVSISVDFVPVAGADILFDDVDTDDWFYDAVDWAVNNGLTAGTTATSFNPNAITTRSQAMTFLWYLLGQPEATIDNPFTDISTDDYYYEAVLWAVEAGITTGTTATTFSPDLDCSRAHIITFLWRSAGMPVVNSINLFTDVERDDYFYDAALWAVGDGITTGTTATTFSPNQDCTRAHIITFLYRALGV